MRELEDRVLKSIQRHRLLSQGDAVLVTVSGGPDSVALLRLLWKLSDFFNLRLEVAHLQHGIRGEESQRDALFVAELAQELKLPFHLKEIDLPQMKSKARKGNLEALARRERQRFFAELTRERGLAKVATAHTQDDQAETVLMWMLRGSGVKGLGGMSPLQVLHPGEPDELVIIRPLLEISKAEILKFLETNHFAHRLDRSNLEQTLLRNWIRLHLMPQLTKRIDAHLPARLVRQAELLRGEESFLQSVARRGLAEMRGRDGLSRVSLLARDKAIQRRVIRLWIEEVCGHLKGIEFAHVEGFLNLIEQGAPQGRLCIPGGWELVKEYDALKIERRVKKKPQACYNYQLEVEKQLKIPEAGMLIESKRVASPLERYPVNLTEAVFDMAVLTAPLRVRNFRNGDRFQPLGMKGRKKVKDLFIEKKAPLRLRPHLPIVCMGAEILWIPGYGRSEIAKVGRHTVAALFLRALSSGP
jgi:tRNA(Ile)-lysidine synthase